MGGGSSREVVNDGSIDGNGSNADSGKDNTGSSAKNGNKVNISGVSYDDKGLKFDFSLNDDTEKQSLGYDDFYNMLIGGGENGTSD